MTLHPGAANVVAPSVPLPMPSTQLSPRAAQAVRRTTLFVALGFAALAFFADRLLGRPHTTWAEEAMFLFAAVVCVLVSRMSGEWNARLLGIGLASLLTLVLSEVAARIVVGRDYSSVLQLDPVVLHRLRPGAEKFFLHEPANGGGRVLVRVNSDGYRGEELDAGARTRVVVFGDSFIEAEVSEEAATYVEQLEDALAQGLGRDVEVVNAGVVAYGPDQVAVRMPQDLARLAPALAVVAIYAGNDYGDLLRNKIVRLDASGAARLAQPAIVDTLRAAFARAKRPVLMKMVSRIRNRPPSGGGATDSAAAERRRHALVDAWLGERVAELSSYQNEPDSVRNLLGDTHDADVSLTPDAPSARLKMQLMSAAVGAIAEAAARANVPVLFVAIPAALDVDERYGSSQVDSSRYPAYSRSRLTDTVRTIVERRGLPVVDLFPAFRAAPRDQLYLKGGDNHWSNAGQALAARVTADSILARGLLAPMRASR